MHKGVILITKADSKEKAFHNIEDFMEQYADNVFDYWKIGGRYSSTLAPQKLLKKFFKYADGLFEKSNGFISLHDVEKNQEKLQVEWKRLGLKGENAYGSPYDMPELGNNYDIVKLSECLYITKEWQQSEVDAKKAEEKAKKVKEEGSSYYRYGYFLGMASHLYKQEFSFDTNVYNTDRYDFSIPKDTKGIYAVMVDMHN